MTPIATKRGNTPQTVIDKYCRQLNKRTYEIDRMAGDPSSGEFRQLLLEKFTSHQSIIEIDFDTLIGEPKPVVENPELAIHELAPSLGP